MSEIEKFPSLVADIMSSPVIALDVNCSTKDAAKIMVENKIGSIVVLDRGRAAGIVTERDMLEKVLAVGKDPTIVELRQIMSSPLIKTDKDATILEAIRKMRHHNIRRLVIMEGDQLVGLVTEKDIIKAVAFASLTSFHSLLAIRKS
mgnify:CR=1 FL=1